MIEVKVDTSGLEDLIKRLEGSNGDLAKVAEAMAEAIHEDADERVPKDTGRLKRSGRTGVAARRIGGRDHVSVLCKVFEVRSKHTPQHN